MRVDLSKHELFLCEYFGTMRRKNAMQLQGFLLLETAIDALNQEQKTCITLFYLQKKSYIEITNSTGYSLLSVKSYIQNGKRNLKISLDKKMNRGYE